MPPPLPPKSNIAVPFAVRVDPTWTADCVRRTLTDEPGKGMGSPFSDADADLFLKVCGLVPAGTHGGSRDAAEAAKLERMWRWVVAHRDE